MIKQIFINLPIKQMARSKDFFSALGFRFNPQFTNEQGACMVINDSTSVMLLVEPFFQGFTKLPVADATRSTEVLLALACESRAEVEELVAKAVANGATTPNEPKYHGFMVQHGFADPDGHQWEVFWMDPNGMPPQA